MINLDGMTFAQKVFTLKWAGFDPPKEARQVDRATINKTPKRQEVNAARIARTYSSSCPYWIAFCAAKKEGKRLAQCHAEAETVWMALKGRTRFSTAKSAKKQYYNYLKHNGYDSGND